MFCKIARKEAQASIIYEDENIIAFLSINPINEGHTLVIPKIHVPDFYDLGGKDYEQVMGVVKILSKKINKIFKPKKVGIIIAGFNIPHTHVHIVPMNNFYDITSKKMIENKMFLATYKELSLVSKKIRGVKL